MAQRQFEDVLPADIADAPMVTALAPASGDPVGGTSVIITGTGFTGATDTAFGPTSAAAMTVDRHPNHRHHPTRHRHRHAFITAALDAASPHAISRKPHPTPTRRRRCATTARISLDRHATYIVAAYLARAAR